MDTKSMRFILGLSFAGVVLAAVPSNGEINVVVERNDTTEAQPGYSFKTIPVPSLNDAATNAEFILVDGKLDPNSGTLEVLHDGQLPTEEDEPKQNFFFDAGTDGGRFVVDLLRVISIKEVNTYSWHPDSRGAQVYTLYASDGKPSKFNLRPEQNVNPDKFGWQFISTVDTRKRYKMSGGQYGVSISDSTGSIGNFRYLLFVASRTEKQDSFGNTFYSEIDVVDRNASEPARPIKTTKPPAPNLSQTFSSADGKYQYTIDPSNAPDLADWSFKELLPVVQEWYPKIVTLLPSVGFEAPGKVVIDFGNDNAGYVAITRGSRITCTTSWFRENLKGEAKGCVVHELVHVVQRYNYGKSPAQRSKASTPSWLSEGIPDYIRWFLYEPQSHGADVDWLRRQKNLKPRHDAGYRVSANFLNWATQKYSKDLVPTLNVALREGKYSEGIWPKTTGFKINKLSEEWKLWLESEIH